MRIIVLALLLVMTSMPKVEAQPGRMAPAARRPEPNSVCVGAGYGVFGTGYVVSLEYQRILGKEGLVSISVPVSWSQSKLFYSTTSSRKLANNYSVLFAAPGIFYHPGGAYNPVDFAIGAQLAIGDVSARSDAYWGGSQEVKSTFIAPTGVLKLNFRSTRSNSIFGLHLAVGPTIQGNFGRAASGSAADAPVFFEGGIRFGGYF